MHIQYRKSVKFEKVEKNGEKIWKTDKMGDDSMIIRDSDMIRFEKMRKRRDFMKMQKKIFEIRSSRKFYLA